MEYRQLVAQVTTTLNSRPSVQEKLVIERLHLRPVPVVRFADYEPLVVRVRSTSTIEVRSVTYSVPSRLIGHQLTVHLRHDRLDLFLRSQFIETLLRLHRRKGEKGALRRIDFRHVIESLRRKPRALLRAQLQADILPGVSWHQLWRRLLGALAPDEAAKVMVDSLHVAASRDDLAGVQRYLERQLRKGELSLDGLRSRYGLRPPRGLAALPQLDIPEHQLSSYDELLVGVLRSFSRPRASNDNPYSESLFRTVKYRPDYPNRPFASKNKACQWVAAFVDWYIHRHLHSGIKFVTPHQRHSGAATAICKQRADVYETARKANPKRWSQSTRCWRQPAEVWINKPPEEPEATLALPLVQAA
jgi:transposase InsO family protein